MALTFEWDPVKADSNLRKHGVSFGEVTTVFGDPLSLTIPDPTHPDEPDRFVTIGETAQRRLVVVSHKDRGDTIRLISAREATPRERRNYEAGG
ncbi:MAG: BrnT family toxin [Planctomycetales bacterium]|nr:BrnT family toxin [Planctomycetales bacterium]